MEIYGHFISNGFEWEGRLPVLATDVEYMTETLTASTILSLRIATEGMKSFAAHLAGEQSVNFRARSLDLKRLEEFARRPNADFSEQISAHMQRNRTSPINVH
ncbi:hypothetical protein [Rhizobium leguminosarum]|uniref:hypothetical protein n=1 Tax=Rhizobium leguminosarum TaxID=384 RepID=UPI001F1C0E6C|nr:hypothetical protein [Rhizobium leguminosarum]UIJ81810.1 hypothetical protein LZK78_11245 [Rhizobium leguminosarum]